MNAALAALTAGGALLVYPNRRKLLAGKEKRPHNSPLVLPVLVASAGAATGYLIAGVVTALLAATAGVAAVLVLRRRAAAAAREVPALRLAASWDLLAACLRSGLGVPQAIGVIADDLPGEVAAVLRQTADLIALGAPADKAWRPALALPATEALGVGAVRSARSGAALADLAAGLAARLRDQAVDAADALAQRAGVLVTGPLGCCFLPAFLCLGVVPVVIGLVGGMLAGWPGR